MQLVTFGHGCNRHRDAKLDEDRTCLQVRPPTRRCSSGTLPRTESRITVSATIVVVVVATILFLIFAMAIRIVTQYERGVHFRLGRIIAVRNPGLTLIFPAVDRMTKVSMRIVTMPIQSQGIITRDNVSVDIAAVAYFRVIDAEKSVVTIESVNSAIDQIAQTTLRNVVGQHSLDEVLSETAVINTSIRQILDTTTLDWGVEVTLVELKDIQLPESMKRAMAREAEAEREKRAKIIAELGVEKNTTVVFPAPLMSAIGELGSFLHRENASAEDLSSHGAKENAMKETTFNASALSASRP